MDPSSGLRALSPKELGTGGANVESLSVFTRPQIVPWSEDLNKQGVIKGNQLWGDQT